MRTIKLFFNKIGWLFSLIYPYNFHKLFSYYLVNYIYSGWIKGVFKTCGHNLFVRRPIYIYGAEFIKIGDNFRSEKGLRLEAHGEYNGVKFTPQISLGNRISINFNCHIAAVNKIIIGDDVLIASNVLITDHFHGEINKLSVSMPTSQRVLNSKGPVEIQNNVWIGENVCIMPNVSLGTGCVVGANSIVTNSFPAGSIIGGVPARLIKTV